MAKNAMFQKSADTAVLENLLSEAKPGDLVSYAEMSEALGRDVRVFARSAMMSAKNILFRERGMVFSARRNEGYVRLNDEEIVDASETRRRHLQRHSSKALRELAVVNFDELPNDKKQAHVTASAQLGAVNLMSRKSSTKRIASKVNGDSKNLAIGQTLKLFT